jgi:uncharacterized DUF497 family protein
MPWLDVVWVPGKQGNIEHIVEHGITQDDVEEVVQDPDRQDTSRSSGRPIAFGYTSSGKYIAVVYEQLDDNTVYPITAYESGA